MTDQLNPLQFVESLIASLTRYARKLEFVLDNMEGRGSVRLESGDTFDSWRCTWVMGSAYHTYQGQGVGARVAVLDCLRKAREDLEDQSSVNSKRSVS